MRIPSLVLCFFLALAQAAVGQEKISPNQTITRKIEPGKTELFSIALNDGDYLNATIGYKGKINMSLLYPDGTIVRRLVGPTSPAEAKAPFVYAAEGGGSYSFKVENPGDQSTSYELAIGAVVSLDERLKPEPWSDPYPSPRMQTLRNQIAAGQTNTDNFWKQVTAETTPLIEPSGSDGKYHLVTFLWRSIHETRNVFVTGSFRGVGPPTDYAMHQIPNSDVWYLTVKLPAAARFTYRLSPNDPMTFAGPRAAQRAATAQTDPLNPHKAECPPNASKFRCISVAELPGAPPQPWLVSKPGVAAGKIEKLQIKSSILKMERPFSVYTPANYKADGPPNALVVMFDGEDLSSDPYQVTTLDNLIAASKIPPTVGVFVENVGNRRLVDLVASPEFTDFLATELMPWIRTHYNIRKEANQVVVGGYSAGGLAATYTGLRHSEVFGNVLSESGAFWWSFEHTGGICASRCPESGGRGGDSFLDSTTEGGFPIKQFLASPKLPLRLYLAVGAFEYDRNGNGGDILENTRHLRDVLLAKGYEVHYQQFVGGHDGLSWRGLFADGLIELLGTR